MRKLLWIIGILAAIYMVAAVAAWKLLPAKLNDANQRMLAVRVAIVQLTKDQWVISERLRTITNQTIGQGKNKIDEVSMMLADPDLNHIALSYTGSDWALQCSSFLGQVAHARKLIRQQEEARKDRKKDLEDKVKDLEGDRLTLIRKIAQTASFHKPIEALERELAVVNVKLAELKTMTDYYAKGKDDDEFIQATAKNEDKLFKLASDFQNTTVGTLNTVLASKLADLKWEESEPGRIQRMASYFNIWPLNLILKFPEGEPDEKRL